MVSYVRRMDLPSQEHVDQRLESVPWDDLIRPPRDPRRRMILGLLALVVAVIAASAARTLWPAPALIGTIDSSLPTPPPAESAVSAPPRAFENEATEDATSADATGAGPQPMSEADLRAVSPADASRTVVAYAEVFVSLWLTLDGGTTAAVDEMLPRGLAVEVVDESARSFVESAVGMSATEIAASIWQVEVVVRSLSAFADGEYVRIPPRAYSVTIQLNDDGPAIVDLPSPAELQMSQAEVVSTQLAEAPESVTAAGRSMLAVDGLIDEATLTTSQAGDLWRVSAVVRDVAGVPTRVVVWLDAAGQQVAVPVG